MKFREEIEKKESIKTVENGDKWHYMKNMDISKFMGKLALLKKIWETLNIRTLEYFVIFAKYGKVKKAKRNGKISNMKEYREYTEI